jgi:hypothetical protein
VSTAAQAQADETVRHRVRYTVSAQNPVLADIYYRDTDPPTWADYSHNPYVFSPKVQADIGPQKAWVLDVVLADPDQWAMVAATSGPTQAVFHCQLEVDGVLVDSDDGSKGALCSIREW